MSKPSKPEVQAALTPNPRRKFLGSMGLVGAGVVLGACGPVLAQPPTNPSNQPNLDTEILNFALNLEYLEAAFYTAAVGRLDELKEIGGDAAIILPDTFTTAETTGINFEDPECRQYAQELAEDELNHVKFLRSALGADAVPRPVINLAAAFAAAANAAARNAGLITADQTLDPPFNPFANELFFLHGAFIFEDVGVTAYKGAAPLITANSVLEPAAGILAIEAYHSGLIRTLLYQRRDVATPYGVPVQSIVQAISNLRDAVDGTTVNSNGNVVEDTDQGVVVGVGANRPDPAFLPQGANIALGDINSIAYSRAPRDVLAIVYLNPQANPGGFFPNGVNGDFSALLG